MRFVPFWCRLGWYLEFKFGSSKIALLLTLPGATYSTHGVIQHSTHGFRIVLTITARFLDLLLLGQLNFVFS